MYLTIADVNPRSRIAAAELADVHRLHTRILDLTDPQPEEGQPRMLWAHLPGRLIIRSPQPIPEQRWPHGYLWASTHQPWYPPTGSVTGVCVVNPVRRNSHTKPGRITTLPIPDGQIGAWLTQRLTSAGIRPASVIVGSVRTASGFRNSARITHRVAVCQVEANVVDADSASRLTLAGVGRARSYGCGLSTWWPR